MVEFKVEIDRYRLDDEWVAQPELYREHAMAAVEARRIWEQAKARLEVVKAEFYIEIKRDPDAYELPKITEAVIAAAVVLQEPVRAAVKAVIKAKESLGYLEAALTSLEHRKMALQKLVELHSTSYYSEPRASGESKEVMDEVDKRAIRRRGQRKKTQDV